MGSCPNKIIVLCTCFKEKIYVDKLAESVKAGTLANLLFSPVAVLP